MELLVLDFLTEMWVCEALDIRRHPTITVSNLDTATFLQTRSNAVGVKAG